MKKIVFGLILGIFLSSGIVYGAVELKVVPNPFPVIINGDAAEVEAYNINGYTYLKLRDFEKAGLIVKFNETYRQIEITSNQPDGEPAKEEDAMGNAPKKSASNDIGYSPNETGYTLNITDKSALIKSSRDGIDVLSYKGVDYITIPTLRNNGVYMAYVDRQRYSIFPSREAMEKLENPIMTDVYYVMLNTIDGIQTCVEYDYYVNTILPLIK